MDLRRNLSPFLPFLVTVTAAAALVEFILLRLLLRGGAFAPAGEIITLAFEILQTVGLIGFYAAAITSGLVLLVVAILIWRPGPRRGLTILILSVLALAALFAILRETILIVLYPFAIMATLALLLLLHPRKRSWDFAGAAAAVVAIGTNLYLLAATNAAGLGWELEYAQEVFDAGEYFAVATPILFILGRRWRPWAAIAGIAAAALFYAFALNPLVPLIVAWTIYLTYFLPIAVYAVALGALVYCLGDMITDPSQRWLGYGLLLVAIAGRLDQTTYLAQLSLLGGLLLILPLAMIVDVFPQWADAPEDRPPNSQ